MYGEGRGMGGGADGQKGEEIKRRKVPDETMKKITSDNCLI